MFVKFAASLFMDSIIKKGAPVERNKQLMLVCEKLLGWKWYRHPSANSLKNPHYRFLAHQVCHEIDQAPQWMIPADMTEKPCSLEYMENEFFFPKLTLDLMWECQQKLSGRQWNEYCIRLERTGEAPDNWEKINPSVVISAKLVNATAEQRLAALVATIGGME